jgi:hypothetical protein
MLRFAIATGVTLVVSSPGMANGYIRRAEPIPTETSGSLPDAPLLDIRCLREPAAGPTMSANAQKRRSADFIVDSSQSYERQAELTRTTSGVNKYVISGQLL